MSNDTDVILFLRPRDVSRAQHIAQGILLRQNALFTRRLQAQEPVSRFSLQFPL